MANHSNPSLIDLRLLRQFVAVAVELHYRRTAERLALSHPPPDDRSPAAGGDWRDADRARPRLGG